MTSIPHVDDRRIPASVGIPTLLALLAAVVAIACALGAYRVNPFDVHVRGVLMDIRLPRVILAALVGSALGASGAALQGLFRNPLADPGLIGVTSGASLGAVAMIVAGAALSGAVSEFALPFAALAGGLAVTFLVWRIARVDGAIHTATLLLAGIALNSISAAAVGVFVAVSNDQQLRGVTFWLMGSLADATWLLVLSVLLPIICGLGLLLPLGRELNALALGERDGFHVGLDVKRTKNRVVAGSAIAVAGAVCAAGGVGFIGLVVPHIARMLLGPNHRLVLPAAALTGAIVLVAADLIARTVIAPAELPVGVVTALIGAPFFLFLLFRVNRENRGV